VTVSAALLLVGQELVEGRAVDTNGPWLARRLTELGVRVKGLRSLPDEETAIAAAIRQAAAEADQVVVSGGLGPTGDDLTRPALALAAGRPLAEDPRAAAVVVAGLARHGRSADAARRDQARVPEGAEVLDNPAGTAPGIRLAVGGATVWALPGVSRELRAMFDRHLVPSLATLAGPDAPATAGLWTAGVGEPDVAEVAEACAGEAGCQVGVYAHEGEVEARFAARGAGATERVADCLRAARTRLGEAVVDPAPLEAAVVAALRVRGWTLATAESMTGGLVARRVVSVEGASEVFAGGWVAYSEAFKSRELGVAADLLARVGAVSPEVAAAMAEGARARSGASVAVAVTGVAGPGPGRRPDGESIPAGTWWLGLARAGAPTETRRGQATLARVAAQHRAAVAALDLVRRSARR
jgi:nicotinamide-nucleotide amidase